jgi:hypothetical protein
VAASAWHQAGESAKYQANHGGNGEISDEMAIDGGV